MSTPRKIAVIVGSLRKDSFNRKIAKVMADVAPSHVTCSFVEIGDLPHYNQDLETATPPPAWARFRQEIKAADALLVVSPEYNRSLPGGLKNAIDVGSRPSGQSVWKDKPAAVAGVTLGPLGAMAGVFAIKQTLGAQGALLLTAPELFIGQAAGLFDAEGKIVDKTREFLHKAMADFATWIDRVAL